MNEQKVTPPIFPNSLIIEPTQSNPEPNIKGLGPLQYLIHEQKEKKTFYVWTQSL